MSCSRIIMPHIVTHCHMMSPRVTPSTRVTQSARVYHSVRVTPSIFPHSRWYHSTVHTLSLGIKNCHKLLQALHIFKQKKQNVVLSSHMMSHLRGRLQPSRLFPTFEAVYYLCGCFVVLGLFPIFEAVSYLQGHFLPLRPLPTVEAVSLFKAVSNL